MKNIYRANMHRILKNWMFIGGCIIALVATFIYTANLIGMTGRFESIGPERRMIFISIAMMGYFTIFVPLYTNAEYRDGTIRNKLIAGFSQKEVYLGTLFSHITALAIMMLCYFLAGIMGGARISADMLARNLIIFLALCSYVSVMELIAMRVKKTVAVAIWAFLILTVSYNTVMVGNFFIAFVLKGTALFIGKIIYNINTFGQWLIHTGFADPGTNPGNLVQILISLAIVLATAFLGTLGINKRDLN